MYIYYTADTYYQRPGFNATWTALTTPAPTRRFAGLVPAQMFNAPLGKWDVSSATTMEGMFHGALGFDADLSAWNTGRVVSIRGMFQYASSFRGTLAPWNVGSVADMVNAFNGASQFAAAGLEGWAVIRMKSASGAFDGTALSDCSRAAIFASWSLLAAELPPGWRELKQCYDCEAAELQLSTFPNTTLNSESVVRAALPLPPDTTVSLTARPVVESLNVPVNGESESPITLPFVGEWEFEAVLGGSGAGSCRYRRAIKCSDGFVADRGSCVCPDGQQELSGKCVDNVTSCDLLEVNTAWEQNTARGSWSMLKPLVRAPSGRSVAIRFVPDATTLELALTQQSDGTHTGVQDVPSTGSWTLQVIVDSTACTEGVRKLTVSCLAGFVDIEGRCECPEGEENQNGECTAPERSLPLVELVVGCGGALLLLAALSSVLCMIRKNKQRAKELLFSFIGREAKLTGRICGEMLDIAGDSVMFANALNSTCRTIMGLRIFYYVFFPAACVASFGNFALGLQLYLAQTRQRRAEAQEAARRVSQRTETDAIRTELTAQLVDVRRNIWQGYATMLLLLLEDVPLGILGARQLFLQMQCHCNCDSSQLNTAPSQLELASVLWSQLMAGTKYVLSFRLKQPPSPPGTTRQSN